MPTCPTCRRRYPEGTRSCRDDGAELLADQAFLLAETTLEPGTRVGEYEVQGLLGEGGFGTVYRAVHPLIGKPAAIKVLKRECSSSPELASRFISEARVVNQIRHKNIIDIFSFGALDDGRHYYVMELLEGMTLDQLLSEKGRLEVGEALPLLRQLARALDAAHAAGIAHRDLKPENVFLTRDEGVLVPKLLDFGLAKLAKSAGSGHKTQSGMPMGTPLYMSPEQVNGQPIDARTDIYSFGILAFELLSGAVPFDGDSLMAIMTKQVSAPPPRLSAVAPDLPSKLDAPLLAMMEKEPSARPQRIMEALEALEAAAGFESPISHGGGALGDALTEGQKSARAARDVGNVSSSVTVRATPAEPASTAAPRTQWTLFVALATFSVAGAVGAAVVWSSMKQVAGPRDIAVRTAISTLPVTSPVVEVGAPPSAQAHVEVEPRSLVVKLRLKTAPPDAEVYLGEAKLGVATEVLELPRGESEITLTIKHAGYAPGRLEVVPTADIADALILKPARVKDYTF